MTAAARWAFDAIGTRWSIDTDIPLDPDLRERLATLIDAFDQEWSRFREDSVVSQLASAGGEVPCPPDAAPMLDLFAELSAATGGAVSPLIGGALATLGYDARYSLVAHGDPVPAPDWPRVLRWEGGMLVLSTPAMIDVGALGKGRLVDLVHAELLRAGVRRVTVDAGGDIRVSGRVERIGLEHPYDPARVVGTWELDSGALCASATTRRAWGDGLHHVLDARTGHPVRTMVATWAVAPSAMVADAAATALFFEGGPALAADWGVQWVRMRTDGTIEWSPESRAELFT